MAPKAAGTQEPARLVGRRDQLASFDARLDDALRSDGSVTLVYGEAGVGKTSLLRAWAEQARPRGFRVSTAACLPFSSEPYGPFAEICRSIAKSEPRAVP